MQHGHRLALSLAGNGGRQIYGEHDDGCADGLWSADYHRVALANMQHAAFLEIAFHNKLGWMVLFFFFFFSFLLARMPPMPKATMVFYTPLLA